MIKAFFLLFIVFLICGCGHKPQMPPDIIPLNRMKVIVWDMEMTDQKAADKFMEQKDSLRMEATSLYQQVFAKHKTGKSDFYKSFTYYEAHPEILKVLFDSVSEYGNRQKTAAYKKAY